MRWLRLCFLETDSDQTICVEGVIEKWPQKNSKWGRVVGFGRNKI